MSETTSENEPNSSNVRFEDYSGLWTSLRHGVTVMLVLILASNIFSIVVTEQTHAENVQLTQLACHESSILRDFVPLVEAKSVAQRDVALRELQHAERQVSC